MKVRRPAAGKRKAVEAAEAVPEAMPEAGPEGVPAQDAGAEHPAGNGLDVTSIDNSPEAANADTGPMTKAKKRKGVPPDNAAVVSSFYTQRYTAHGSRQAQMLAQMRTTMMPCNHNPCMLQFLGMPCWTVQQM